MDQVQSAAGDRMVVTESVLAGYTTRWEVGVLVPDRGCGALASLEVLAPGALHLGPGDQAQFRRRAEMPTARMNSWTSFW